MVNVFIWTLFVLFAVLMVAASFAGYIPQAEDTAQKAVTAERVVEEQELPMLKKWLTDLVAGRALSDKDRCKVEQSLSRLREGKSFICVARWVVCLLEHCPSANWHAISFYVKRSHEALEELRSRKTSAKVAENVSTCFAGCDSLMYVMRKNELLVETV